MANHAHAAASDIQQQAERAHDKAQRTAQRSTKLERLARAGYIARGVVYVIVGVLAVMAAFGEGGQTGGSKSALAWLTTETWGTVVLVLLGLGLVGFAIWRAMQGLIDADKRGSDGKALALRTAHVISGILYTLLAITAFTYAFGGSGGGQGGQSGGKADSATAWLMSQAAGQWLVGLVGAAIIIFGVVQLTRAIKASFERFFVADERKMKVIRALGRAGLTARAVVFFIIGGFLIVAAYQADPQEARGLGGALRTLQAQPYGPWLLALVAIGLAAFGAFSVTEGMYRRVPARAK